MMIARNLRFIRVDTDIKNLLLCLRMDRTVFELNFEGLNCVFQTSGSNNVPFDCLGRVCYEQSGEMFFLSHTIDDVDNSKKLSEGDKVSFLIGTDKR